MKEGQPKAVNLKDYEVPPFLIESTDLHVEIHEAETLVTTTLTVRRNPDAKTPATDLVLDGGEGLDTRTVTLDDRELLSNEYAIDEDSLTLFGVPDEFKLQTRVAIKPQDNTALEGRVVLRLDGHPGLQLEFIRHAEQGQGILVDGIFVGQEFAIVQGYGAGIQPLAAVQHQVGCGRFGIGVAADRQGCRHQGLGLVNLDVQVSRLDQEWRNLIIFQVDGFGLAFFHVWSHLW